MKSYSIDAYFEHLSACEQRHREVLEELRELDLQGRIERKQGEAALAKEHIQARRKGVEDAIATLQRAKCAIPAEIARQLEEVGREEQQLVQRLALSIEELRTLDEGNETTMRRAALQLEHDELEAKANTRGAWEAWLGAVRHVKPDTRIHVMKDQAELEDWILAHVPATAFVDRLRDGTMNVAYWPATLAWRPKAREATLGRSADHSPLRALLPTPDADVRWVVEAGHKDHPLFDQETKRWREQLLLHEDRCLDEAQAKDVLVYGMWVGPCPKQPPGTGAMILIVGPDRRTYLSRDIVESTAEMYFRRSLGSNAIDDAWRQLASSARISIHDLSKVLDEPVLAARLEAQALARVQKALLAAYEPWTTRATEERHANEERRTKDVLERLAHMPWSDELVGNLAVLKHLAMGKQPVVHCWPTALDGLYGLRARTNDHDWILGRIWSPEGRPANQRARVLHARPLRRRRGDYGVVELQEGDGSIDFGSSLLRVAAGREQ
ncbi:MAG: hypothetical protein ACK57N_12360 [Planctomycetia bacterium]